MNSADTTRITRPTAVRAALERIGLRPDRSLGQNFLVDANILGIIVKAADLGKDDRVLEVGPGLGVVTEQLLAACGSVIAVEKDRRLAQYLREQLGGRENFTLIEGDALDVDLESILAGGDSGGPVTCMVSNLPYVAGSRILMTLFAAPVIPARIVVTLQKEVAERLTAEPGTSEYGLLTVWAQRRYDVRVTKIVSPGCFWPVPAVSSAVVTLSRREPAAFEPAVNRMFCAVTRHAFSQRRKMVAGTLSRAPAMLRADAPAVATRLRLSGAGAEARPEDLSADQWYAIAEWLQARREAGIV